MGNLNIKLRKPIYGWGINDSDYATQPNDRSKRCPIFDKWHSMIRRCYSEDSLKKYPLYTNVKVTAQWKYFSKFKVWMESQNWKGMALDKDWIGDGTLYSPETCRFIPTELNAFLSENLFKKFPGARLKFLDGRYKPYISQAMVEGKKKHLGVFSSEFDAHRAWQIAKLKELQRLSEVYTNLDLDIQDKMKLIENNLIFSLKHGKVTSSLKELTETVYKEVT